MLAIPELSRIGRRVAALGFVAAMCAEMALMEAPMKTVLKYAALATVAGALVVAAASPSDARNGRNTAAAIGFGAGALVGAAAVSANNGYYRGYGPGYYGSGYAYEPGYAYERTPVYVAPRDYGYRDNYHPPCAVDMGYKLDYSSC